MIRVPYSEALNRLTIIFERADISVEDAATLAEILATNSLEGVLSHGLPFVEYILIGLREGRIDPQARPSCIVSFGAWEQWDGNFGLGPLNALRATDRAMELATQHGVGVVALRKTTHWTRAGFYGQRAARSGFGFICWTNTPAVMPPWGSSRPRLGNNPIVLALPHGDSPLVLDMALSQFAIGRLEIAQVLNATLSVDGGYDDEGNLTRDPNAILRSGRALPIGFWKGSGMALLLDLLAASLAGGKTTLDNTENEKVESISQVFIAFDLGNRLDLEGLESLTDRVLNDLRQNWEGSNEDGFHYPGQSVAERRADNLREGILVDADMWQGILLESSASSF